MPVIEIDGLTKTYKSGLQALKRIDLSIDKGEIFALLGPNGAGKTTLISIICGIVTPTTGTVVADGHDIQSDFRAARTKIGLVPQELTTDGLLAVCVQHEMDHLDGKLFIDYLSPLKREMVRKKLAKQRKHVA